MDELLKDKLADAERGVDAMGFLLRLAAELNSTLELDEVLRRVAEQVKYYVDYDTFAILLLDSLGQELHFRFC